LLANVVGREGNLLLNVGPDRNGKIDEPQAEHLREIGAWLTKYGDSIYATRGGPFLPGDRAYPRIATREFTFTF